MIIHFPGTFQTCTNCTCHREHYLGSRYGQEAVEDTKGWFYCDRFVEVINFPRLDLLAIPEVCPWFLPGRETHRTPLNGVRQALWLGWTPGPVNSPNSHIDPNYVAKKIMAEEILRGLAGDA